MKRTGYVLTLFFLFIFLFTGCSMFFAETEAPEEEKTVETVKKIKKIRKKRKKSDNPLDQVRTLYIQSFTGQRKLLVRDILLKALQKHGRFNIVEVLPDSLEHLAVLRVRVQDFSIWENEELTGFPEEGVLSEEKKAQILMRRNALVSIVLSLFEADTGKPLIQETYSQPFQQIYVGLEIEKRPTKDQEMLRLVNLLSLKISDSIRPSRQGKILDFEQGKGIGWFSKHIYDFGNRRLIKGNQFASTGDYNSAIWVWKLVLYGPEEGETPETYRINRAGAYFNLGLIYEQDKDWRFAATMFSKANRLEQKTKYAQAWGDNMERWLLEEKKTEIEEKEPKKEKKLVDIEQDLLAQKEPAMVKRYEQNMDLLLNARKLWPLESKLKNISDEELMKEEKHIEEEEEPQLVQPVPLMPLKPNN